jgi:hypothetical protein
MRLLKLLSICLIFLFILICCEGKGLFVPPPVRNQPDTTSHNFTWQIDTFGCVEHLYYSILWDIFVVNENDVWAVGEIHTDETDKWNTDSTVWIQPYSAVHWNGINWEYKRIKEAGYPDSSLLIPIRSIWYFSPENIWLAIGAILQYDGKESKLKYLNDSDNGEMVEQLWAASENEIYGVGTKGLIVKYDGNTWQKINSGTTMDFWDVWGVVDAKSKQTIVYAVGLDQGEIVGIILEIRNGIVTTLFDKDHRIYGLENDHTHPDAVWIYKDSVFVAMAGWDDTHVYRHPINNFSKEYELIYVEPQGALRSINGNSYHDIMGVGYNDVVWHFNGNTFKEYFSWPYLDARYYSVKQYGDCVFACGNSFVSLDAYILRGKR